MTDPQPSSRAALGAHGALDPSLYRDVFYAFDQGFCIFEVLVDATGQPVDYRFVEVNHTFEELTGLTSPVGKTALELVPNLEPHWVEVYGRVALTGESTRFVQGSAAMGRWFEVHASRIGQPERRLVALLFNDITAHRQLQEERERAEDALRASEHRFRVFADTAPAMLWVSDVGGECNYLSRGWYEYTGQNEAEGLGYGWLEAVHPADRANARQTFVSANAEQKPFELEHRVRRADGVYRWVIDAGRPRFGPGGSFDGFIGSVIDIHDRKLAESRLDLAVNSGEVGLWYCDLPFDVLVWNRQVKEHFGLPPDAVVTIDTFFERLHPDDREPTRSAIAAAIAARTTFDTHYRTVALDGRMRWIRAIGRARYEEDRPVSFDGITIDVTELVMLREGAEAANRAKDEFLAMLGHELRNPLAPILTALQLLKLRGIEAAERERAIIERQVRHLVGLVDDLLDVSRITRGRIDLRKERIDLAEVVVRAVEIASPVLEQQRHYLDVDVPRGLLIDGDAGRMAQVVANLLTNAAKYTEPGGQITVSGRESGDHVVLTVRDTGIGIDQQILPHIFDLFVQERQTLARSQGGLGLGLAIVRSLVELHGGTVTATSGGKGQGAEFSVRLPRIVRTDSPPPADVSTTPQKPDRRLVGTRVLIVDDNDDAAELLGVLVREFGYDTRVVHDGPSALTEAEGFEPQVALVDLGLPVMDGFELAQRFLEHPRLRDTKLIAVTGYGQQRDRETSARVGFAAHLVKPVDVDELRSVLDSIAKP
jgi:PAS domain S-box-containing protein